MSGSRPVRAVAYARVSTLLGQDANLQLVNIRQFAEARGFELVDSYIDQGISGIRERRPSLDRMIADARRGRFKVLIVAALDRIGRNTKHLLTLIDELAGYGVRLVSLRESIDLTTPQGQLVLTILSAVSQLEREITRERIRSALQAKKLAAQQAGSSWRCGRPPVLDEELTDQVLLLHSKGYSVRAIEQALDRKVGRSTISRCLRAYAGAGGVRPKNHLKLGAQPHGITMADLELKPVPK